MAGSIRPIMLPKGRELIEHHRAQGHELVIVTATNSFVTAPIAQELGVAHLIATEPEHQGGEFTGKVAGTPSFRDGKVKRLEEWLQSRGRGWAEVAESWFYSDSLNDLPLLSRVTHPVAVDPDDTLRAHALENGWPVISLR